MVTLCMCFSICRLHKESYGNSSNNLEKSGIAESLRGIPTTAQEGMLFHLLFLQCEMKQSVTLFDCIDFVNLISKDITNY